MKTQTENKASEIAIIDNRPMFRLGIKDTLKNITPQYNISEYKSFEELASDKPISNSVHFLIRVGSTPDKTIVNNIRKLKLAYESCKIILYDYQESINYIIAFFRENIDAYLPDNFDENDLRECMASVESNRLYVNTQIAVQLLTVKPQARPERNIRLTPTEVKVARFLVRGMKPSLIAKEMDRKISTISTIKSNIFKKTKVNNIIDLVGAMDNVPVGVRM